METFRQNTRMEKMVKFEAEISDLVLKFQIILINGTLIY